MDSEQVRLEVVRPRPELELICTAAFGAFVVVARDPGSLRMAASPMSLKIVAGAESISTSAAGLSARKGLRMARVVLATDGIG